MVLAYSTTRNIREYNHIYDVELTKAWDRLNISTPEPEIKVKESCQETHYFDTGLNLEKVRYKRKSVESSSPTLEKSVAAASTDLAKGQSELPKYGFVEMLQQAFGVNDLLEKNRFLNKSVAEQITLIHTKKKRVSFAKTEISEKHLPLCRKRSFQTEHEKFGHLHAPQCRNFVAEQALDNQEFLIRGQFIKSNVKKPESEQEFFCDPPASDSELLVRQIPPLSSSLADTSSCLVQPLDLKGSCMDSINYHDKCSPNLRHLPAPPNSSVGSSADSTSSRVESPEFAPPSLQKVRPMPCQPVFTDTDIVSTTSFKKESGGVSQLDVYRIPVIKVETQETDEPKESKQNNGSLCGSTPERTSLFNLAPSPKERTTSLGSSIDSGIESLKSEPLEFVDDFIGNLSSDSDEDDVIEDGIGDVMTKPTNDSGFNSLSDDDENIDDLIKQSSHKRPVQTKMWFTIPGSKKCGTDESKRYGTELQSKELESSEVSEELRTKTDVKSGYFNPFTKKLSMSVNFITSPSVLGHLICENKQIIAADRWPDTSPDMFMFDTLSPDDLIKSRQRNLMP